MMLLWSGTGQCDWWISSTDAAARRSLVDRLRLLSDLEISMWSDDAAAEDVLRQLRGDR
jgi:hypothetical protein